MTIEDAISIHRNKIISESGIEQIKYMEEIEIKDTIQDAKQNNSNIFTGLKSLKNYIEGLKDIIQTLNDEKSWETAGGTYTKAEIIAKVGEIEDLIADMEKYIYKISNEKVFSLDTPFDKKNQAINVYFRAESLGIEEKGGEKYEQSEY